MSGAGAPGGGRVGAIWAEDRTGLLGNDGAMVWRVPADFRHFKEATVGGALVMGRRTWDSLHRALAGRRSIVLTRQLGWRAEGAATVAGLEEGLSLARDAVRELGADPRRGGYRLLPRVWVIGGGSVYRQALEAAVVDDLVISTIDLDARGLAGASGFDLDRPVYAPPRDPGAWAWDAAASDEEGSWRSVSGDAAWRVDHWKRR